MIIWESFTFMRCNLILKIDIAIFVNLIVHVDKIFTQFNKNVNTFFGFF